MRALIRNKVPFYYALYEGSTEIMRNSRHTGEYSNSYSTPILTAGNISAGTGNSDSEWYGLSQSDYDKIIVMDEVSIPLNESSILWVDNLDTSKPYDYIVKRVARSLNSVSIAIKKVTVDAG